MNKLFGLFLLAVACWVPDVASAANRFLTCNTTCTITAADTSIWGTTTGGTGASVPGTSDDVILDGATCVGGTTCTATFGPGYNPTWISLTMSACTASTSGCILEANTNGNTITLTSNGNAYINTGSGTRTLSGGTWVLSGTASVWNIAASGTITNNPSVTFSGTTGISRRTFTTGGKTYGTVTVVSSSAPTNITGAATIGTFTVSAPNWIGLGASTTLTVTTFNNVSGNSSSQALFISENPQTGIATIASANNWTCDWCGFAYMTFSGGGTFSGTNSFKFGNVTGITVTAPSGGAGGGRIIGG